MARSAASRTRSAVLTALLALMAGPAAAELSGAVRTEPRDVAGLQQPAQILIDLWRKRGLGLLARDFGPDYPVDERRIGFGNRADPARWQRITKALFGRRAVHAPAVFA